MSPKEVTLSEPPIEPILGMRTLPKLLFDPILGCAIGRSFVIREKISRRQVSGE